MATPELKVSELDLCNGTSRILENIAETQGAYFGTIAKVTRRVLVLQSPFAPNVSFLGAEAQVTGVPRTVGSDNVIASSGVGMTPEDALSSCLAEMGERLSIAEHPADVILRAPINGAQCSSGVRDLAQTIATTNGVAEDAVVDWVAAESLGTATVTHVPADWCLRRATGGGALRLPGAPLSVGIAAGRTRDDARLAALLEAIERDAVAAWWIGGNRGRPIALETQTAREAVSIVATARGHAAGRLCWLLDVTTDIGVPTVSAVSISSDGKGLACGMAARPTTLAAARAALFELLQMELGMCLAAVKLVGRGDAALGPTDRMHLQRANGIDAATCALLHPTGIPTADVDVGNGDRTLHHICERLAALSMDVAFVDLTRPEIGIPVAAAIVPNLQKYPCDFITPRLARAVEATGGGTRWTRGIPLA